MKRQTRLVLELLRAHPEGVTPALAREEVGTDRLAARIWELRHLHGIDIEERRIVVPTRGGGAHVASYRIATPEQRELWGTM